MKKITLLLITLFSLSLHVSAQDKSKEILDNLGKKIDKFSSLYIEYSMRVENKQASTSKTEDGKLLSKGTSFKLSSIAGGYEIYSNGVDQWMFLKKEKEVTISKADPSGNDIFSNPVKFLTGQRKDFKYKFKGNVEEDGKNLIEIDYYPVDLKAPYSYIRLRMSEKDLVPHSIRYVGKSGVNYTIRINNYTPNLAAESSDFVFSNKDPDLEVIDLR